VALRRVFDGGSVGCGDDDLRRDYRTTRCSGYGKHTQCGELQWRPEWRRAAALTEETVVTASDESGRNASAFNGAWRQATGQHVPCDVAHDLRPAGPGGGDGQ
jgi:hypothetical protein